MGEISFHDAIISCPIQEIEAILVADPSLATHEPGCDPPIIWAAGNHRPDVVDLLIKHGADIEVTDDDGKTALHAAASECPEVVSVLLNHGAKLDVLDRLGCSPLVWAIWMQRSPEGEEAAKLLHGAGATVDLMAAAALGDLVEVRNLINLDPSGVQRVRSPEILLALAVSVCTYGTTMDRVQIVRLLLANGLKLDMTQLLNVAATCETSGLTEYASVLRGFVDDKK